jgi:hypothetical protein
MRSVYVSPRRLKLITVVTAALFFMGSNVAFACLCLQFGPTDAARNAATVFTGVARGRVAPPAVVGFFTSSGEGVEFNVETVYKGVIPSRFAVTVDATDCGYVFADGERYTVFVTSEGRTNLCMGNVRGAIDPATYGVQAITTYPSQPLEGDQNGRLALAAIVVAALGAIAVFRMRRSRPA